MNDTTVNTDQYQRTTKHDIDAAQDQGPNWRLGRTRDGIHNRGILPSGREWWFRPRASEKANCRRYAL